MRRLVSITLGALAICTSIGTADGWGAVTRDQFPPRTTGDLVALCSAGKDDPLMTAAVNFCNGFVEGAVELALGYETVSRKGRQPFCLPTPTPSHNDAVAQFASWANGDPKRLDEPPGLGLTRFLVHQYPCSHGAPAPASAGTK
ncbi:MAG TPA: Rap1a/Tai family immunity protein [Rhodopila sp.]